MRTRTRRIASFMVCPASLLCAAAVVGLAPGRALGEASPVEPASSPAVEPTTSSWSRATQPPPSPPPPTKAWSLGAVVALTHVSEEGSSSSAIMPVPQAAFALRRGAGLEVEWPLALLIDSRGLASTTVRTGNPRVGAWYRGDRQRMHWLVGLAATAPLATVSLGGDGRLQRQLYNQAAAAWGMWDSERWAPGRLAIPLQGSLSYDVDVYVRLFVDAAVGPLFGVRSGEEGTELLARGALGVRLQAGSTFWLAPSLQTVLLPSASVDRFQSAAIVRAGWTSGFGKLCLGLVVNLDEPLGVVGRGTQAWGLHIAKELDL